jgi:hypothetical protein
MADSPADKSRWIAALNFFRAEAMGGGTAHHHHKTHSHHHQHYHNNPHHNSRQGSATPPPSLHINATLSASSPTLSTPPLHPSTPPHASGVGGAANLFGLYSPLRSGFGRPPSSPLARHHSSSGDGYGGSLGSRDETLFDSAATVVSSTDNKIFGAEKTGPSNKRWSASFLRGAQ